jgi:hypothetical protein
MTENSLAVVLTPNNFDSRPKSHTIGARAWSFAVRLADKVGGRFNLVGGIAKRDVTELARTIKKGLDQDRRVSDEDRAAIERLVAYLKGDGANAGGLTLSRGFRRWDQW